MRKHHNGVPPRLNNTNFADKIKRFNAQLCQMADDHNCPFVNQHDGFHLVSGNINDVGPIIIIIIIIMLYFRHIYGP